MVGPEREVSSGLSRREGGSGGGGGGEGLETSAAQTNRWSGLDGRGQLITPQVVTASPLRFAGQKTSYRGSAVLQGTGEWGSGGWLPFQILLASLSFPPTFNKRQRQEQKRKKMRIRFW